MKIFNIFKRLIFSIILMCAFSANICATEYKIEAEDGTYSNSSVVSDTKYSGGKAIKATESTASLALSFNIEKAGKYKIVVMAEGIGSEKTVNCSINSTLYTFKTYEYDEVVIDTIRLSAGTTTITITPNWTWYNIDYVRLESVESTIIFDIPSSPVTSDATQSACKLYSFLKNNFGKRTVSGIMTGNMDNSDGTDIKSHEDVKAVYDASGKYPALVGFDFMNATGKDVDDGNTWYTNYTKKAISLAKNLWELGGIPAFSWHWRDPSRSTTEFYSSKTSFDFTTAMNDDSSWNTSSTVYQYMKKDIDAVADYFLQLQDDGVACIFRPLHEAPGAWFWWGAKGADAYKSLYLLVYDEMVNVKGVKNVIWDWNTDYSVSGWCPGTDYFDITSTDIYNDAYDYSSNYVAFDKLKTLTNGKRLISLAECGPVPDIENEVYDDAMWSHWMVWYNSWSGGFVSQTSNTEWAKCMTDSCVITLEDMTGWSSSTPGDVDEDGDIDMDDVTALRNYILGRSVSPFNIVNADVNIDTNINVSDVSALIKLLINK